MNFLNSEISVKDFATIAETLGDVEQLLPKSVEAERPAKKSPARLLQNLH